MMRAKSPFKKKLPKEETGEDSRPPMRHWTSVQEFEHYRNQQHLISGNAFAQERANRERTGSTVHQSGPQTSMTIVGQFIEAGGRDSPSTDPKTPSKKKKKCPPPPLKIFPQSLKLLPEGSEHAVPTQREFNEATKHKQMEANIYRTIMKENEAALMSNVSINSEKIEKRPKSPGKKFFQFLLGGSPPPKTPEVPVPPKAIRILGQESIGRKRGKKLAAAQRKIQEEGYDFKCSGPRSGPRTIEDDYFDAPSDLEIRKAGGAVAVVSPVPAQRAVSDSATLVGGKIGEFKDDEAALKHISDSLLRTKSLQYMNNCLPPTPPSKESFKARAVVTDYPPRSISTVPENDDPPETPNTAILYSAEHASPLPRNLTKFHQSDYVNLVLNHKSSLNSLCGSIGDSDSVSSHAPEYVNCSTEMLISSYLDDDKNLMTSKSSTGIIYSLVSITSSEHSSRSSSPSLRRRWSDGSLMASKTRDTNIARLGDELKNVLFPSFYSPANYDKTGFERFKPSQNKDRSVFLLPTRKTAKGYQALESSPEQDTPPSSTNQSSFTSDSDCNHSINDHNIGLGVKLSPFIASQLNGIGNISPDAEARFRAKDPPSAMPEPLQFSHQSNQSAESINSPLPAGPTLDAYLALHNHIDHNSFVLHDMMIKQNDTVIKEVIQKHHDNIKLLTTQFGDVMDRVKAIEHETGLVSNGLDGIKHEITDSLNQMSNFVQNNLVKIVDQLIEGNGAVSQKVDLLLARVQELEKQQKCTGEIINSRLNQQPSITPNSRPSTMCSTESHSGFGSFPTSGPTSFSGMPDNFDGAGHAAYFAPPNYPPPAQWNGFVMPYSHIKGLSSKDQRQMYTNGFAAAQNHQDGGMVVHPAFRNGDGQAQ